MVGFIKNMHLRIRNAFVQRNTRVQSFIRVFGPNNQSWDANLFDSFTNMDAVDIKFFRVFFETGAIPKFFAFIFSVNGVPFFLGGGVKVVIEERGFKKFKTICEAPWGSLSVLKYDVSS